MDGWNYRIMKNKYKGKYIYGLFEVYYENFKPCGWSAEPEFGWFETKSEIVSSLKRMLKDASNTEKKVLLYKK